MHFLWRSNGCVGARFSRLLASNATVAAASRTRSRDWEPASSLLKDRRDLPFPAAGGLADHHQGCRFLLDPPKSHAGIPFAPF
jgi:hypothetical protein